MKKLAGYGVDDHPAGDEDRPPTAWSVALGDDCEACDDLRVEMTLEEAGQAGRGITGHLAPVTARRLRAALATALREMGEAPGP
jgi:hypothetical protein